MTALPEGFVPHDGGPCPVPLDSEPEVIIRGFERWHLCRGDVAADYSWHHCQHAPAADIIAYRPTQQEPTHD